MAEVSTSDDSDGMVLDDPTISLDQDWKAVLALKLIDMAAKKQIIIFTHDLFLLYLLKKCADDASIPLITHWIRRGATDNLPGYISHDNTPAIDREFRSADRAQRYFARAKIAPAEEQEELLRQGFSAIRTSYEAFVIYDLFNEVVQRFSERISLGRLKDIVWNKEIADQVITNHAELSVFIEGHLHREDGPRPTLERLMKEISAFIALKNQYNQYSKQKS